MPKENLVNRLDEAVSHFPVAGIGASAGGLDAFKQFIHALPENTGMAFLLMQHLDPSYETALAEILQRETSLEVMDLEDDMQLAPDHVYIIPSNKLLIVKNGALGLELRPGKSQPPYSLDIFFSALAEIFQSHSIGVLLSGTGTDGTLGLKKIKDYGGVTFAQSPASSKYPDMPRHAIEAGVVDFDLSPDQLPQQLLKVNNTLRIIPVNGAQLSDKSAEEDQFRQILFLLRRRRDVDFTYYKQSTIRRRILRRMLVNKMEDLGSYVALLDNNFSEQDILYQDLLIPVTSFFRDYAVFENLCNKVFPEMFELKNRTTPVRIWVAGCSTGEEAYSLGICIHEFLGEKLGTMKLQLFATDISEKAVQKARTGMYSKRELEGVSATRLQQYFTKTDGHYQVKKSIRDMCVFATHNFLKDPPFAKMDFISCRNVLIYMESYLQKRALGTFHYALNEKGKLLLGKSETAGNASELFKVVGKQDKLYVRKPLNGSVVRPLPDQVKKAAALTESVRRYNTAKKEDFQKNADDVILAKYTPPGVVVNEQYEIVQFRGSTGPFLEGSPGKASLSILKMAREGLSFELRNALHKAKETKEVVIKNDIPVRNGKSPVSIEVVPLLHTIEPHYLILFKETLPHIESGSTNQLGETAIIIKDSAEQKRIRQLEKDLAQVREDMRTITEEQEAANEELQSANEELLSGSEELQSLNEELETSKEELQSTNEELMTVNQELYERNEQYNQSRLYAESIVRTIREPLLVLTKDLRIRSANTSFYETFRLAEDRITNKILFELEDSQWNISGLRTQLLKIQTGQLKQVEWEVDFSFPESEQRIMLLNAHTVNPETGEERILLAFDDITLWKREQARLLASAETIKKELYLIENFFFQAPALFCIFRGADHIFEFANPRYLQVSGGEKLKGKRFGEAFPELENAGYKDILDRVYRTGNSFLGREMKATHYPGKESSEEIFIDLSCQAFRNDQNEIEGVLFFSYEVTQQVKARRQLQKNAEDLEQTIFDRTSLLQASNDALEESNKNLQEFAAIASHDLQEPLRKIKTFTGMLKDRYAEMLPDAAKSLVVKTQESANRMSALIRDVLNYSRIGRPENSFLNADLNIILKNVINDFELLAEEKKAVFEIKNDLPVLEAVPTQMNQLFYNLVGNSLKFTARDRAPFITVSSRVLAANELSGYPSLHPQDAYCMITISDNGIGFEQQFAEQIFSIFERLNTNYEGTGIGLALCRKIVHNHNGLIWSEGKENEGTSFYIILPLKHSGINVAPSIGE